MPDDSFAESAASPASFARATEWSKARQGALLALNILPFCHIAAVVLCAVVARGLVARGAVILAGVYLVPPILVRLLSIARPQRAGSYALDAPDFLWWWASAQWQVLFCRFPFLEEALRLVPGIYSAWLRLWGAKIGSLTYWAPEVRILDRSLLEIGDGVVFGMGVRINPHVIAGEGGGSARLHLGPVSIGSHCRIGGYSLLTAGTVIEPGQTLKAFSLSPPFSRWSDGRRCRVAVPQ